VQEPSPKVIDVLLRWPKTNVESRSAKDESPLMLAALQGNLDLAKKLIERGADVNKTGWTPLHYAATNAHLDLINLLLENYAYIDAESPNKTTPLMMAAMYGSSEAVKLLLDAGADPTLRNELGLSAIDFANKAGRRDSAELIAAVRRGQQPRGTW
jgi:ankyrin repeat protein